MSNFTEDDVTAATDGILADVLKRDEGPLNGTELALLRSDVLVILAAVAPAIAARARRDALNEAADALADERMELQRRNRPEYAQTIREKAAAERALKRGGQVEVAVSVQPPIEPPTRREVANGEPCQTHLHTGSVPQCRKCWPAKGGDGHE